MRSPLQLFITYLLACTSTDGLWKLKFSCLQMLQLRFLQDNDCNGVLCMFIGMAGMKKCPNNKLRKNYDWQVKRKQEGAMTKFGARLTGK